MDEAKENEAGSLDHAGSCGSGVWDRNGLDGSGDT